MERSPVSRRRARKHLRALVNAGGVTTTEEGGAICYRRSATAIVTEHAEALLDEQTPPELDVTDADTDHGSILTE